MALPRRALNDVEFEELFSSLQEQQPKSEGPDFFEGGGLLGVLDRERRRGQALGVRGLPGQLMASGVQRGTSGLESIMEFIAPLFVGDKDIQQTLERQGLAVDESEATAEVGRRAAPVVENTERTKAISDEQAISKILKEADAEGLVPFFSGDGNDISTGAFAEGSIAKGPRRGTTENKRKNRAEKQRDELALLAQMEEIKSAPKLQQIILEAIGGANDPEGARESIQKFQTRRDIGPDTINALVIEELIGALGGNLNKSVTGNELVDLIKQSFGQQ